MTNTKKANKSKGKDPKSQYFGRIGLIIVSAILLIGVLWLWLHYLDWTEKLEPWQQGDAFGSLNALFSGLAFAGLIITILMQGRELGLQRQELENSVDAQRDIVDEAKKDRNTQQAMRLLRCYADWMAAMVETRNILAPMEPVLGLSSFDDKYQERAVGAAMKLSEHTQLLELLDPEFAAYHLPKAQWSALVGEVPKKVMTPDAATPFDLIRAAVFSVEEGQSQPPRYDHPSKCWLISLNTQKLAVFAHETASTVLRKAKIRLHRLVTISGD